MVIGLDSLLVVFFTLCIFSMLFKDNPFTVFAEHTFVATAQAFALVAAIGFIMDYGITPLQSGNYLVIIPILLGLATYLRYTEKYRWVARYPIALSIGVGMGITLRAVIEVSLTSQIQATIVPLFITGNLTQSLENILVVVTVITSLLYFYFSRPHTGALGTTSRIGYYLIYIAFGAYFANTFMSRTALVNGRMVMLLNSDNMYLTIGMIVVIVATVYVLKTRNLLRKSMGYEM